MDPEHEREQEKEQENSQEKADTDQVHISIQNLEDILNNRDQEENENDKEENENEQESPESPHQEFPATTDQPMTKNNNLLLDVVSKKKIKEPKPKDASIDEDKPRERRPSVTFNLNYKYNPSEEPTKKKNMISYIEESFKLTQKTKRPRSLPPLPKKQLAISLCLLVIGLICILVGTILAIENNSAGSGTALWIIGALCGLPGAFYGLKFCRACYATTAESRVRALEEIPQE